MEVYQSAIKPACEESVFCSLRVDELEGMFNINKKIIQNIFLSEAVIAALTHWNPNVFYEMGVAHAIDNKTIMIIQQGHKLPFDVSDYRCIQYQQTLEGMKDLMTKLVGTLKNLEQWQQEPSNPVQDFMPPETALSLPKFNALQREFEKLQHEYETLTARITEPSTKPECQNRIGDFAKATANSDRCEQQADGRKQNFAHRIYENEASACQASKAFG